MAIKYKFLACLTALAMAFTCTVPAVFADDTEAAASEGSFDYSMWQAGDSKADDTSPGSIVPNTVYDGRDTLYIENRNAYTVLDTPVSSGKYNISLDLYLEAGARNFRIYLENAESSYTESDNVFAEVLNSSTAGMVCYGPGLDASDSAHKLFSFTTDGWYHFDITLDYSCIDSDGTCSSSDFITIKAYDDEGYSAGTAKIGAREGKQVALKSIRIVKIASGLYASNIVTEEVDDSLKLVETLNFENETVGNTPSGWSITDTGSYNTTAVTTDSEKGNVFELTKGYDDTSNSTATTAVYAQYELGSDYTGNTLVEADVNVTVAGRIGLYATTDGSKIDTSTTAPRIFAWGKKNYEADFDGWLAYDGDSKASQVKTSNPTLNSWQTWSLDIDTDKGTYDVYIDGTQLYSGLSNLGAVSDSVGGVGFHVQKEGTMLGTILVSEVRVYNNSVLSDDEELAIVENALASLALPSSVSSGVLPLTTAITTRAGTYTVSWASDNTDIINNSGYVVRASSVSGDVDVNLTATIEYGSGSASKTFTVTSTATGSGSSSGGSSSGTGDEDTIKALILEDLMAVGLDDLDVVTSNIDLPTEGSINGSSISWITSNANIISTTGKVTRPSVSGTKTVKLTAVGTLDGYKETYAYNIKVSGKGTSSSSSSGGSSYVSSSSKTTTSTSTAATTTDTTASSDTSADDAASTSAVFNDLDSTPWASEAIGYMYEKGFIDGMGDGSFAPTDMVTREQFVKMLVNSFGLTADEENTVEFDDVDSDAWYSEYIAVAASLGIVNGVDDSTFGVGSYISRQDMAVMIARCLELDDNSESAESFADSEEVSSYAVGAVGALSEAGYFSGDDNNNFNPTDAATRAETAMVLYRIISAE